MPYIAKDQSSKLLDMKKTLKTVIDNSEREFSKKNNEPAVGFLWEHTLIVASITRKIAKLEGIDPFLPEITALFHDSGKFKEGVYHVDDIPEEETAAEIAEKVLNKYEFDKRDIIEVKKSLLSLYDERKSGNLIADLIHDADFLSKFGSIGVAAFFTKMVLRGRNINDSILGYLSKELTYASVLPMNMRTDSGRKLAEKKKEKSINFFTDLIDELKEDGINEFLIKKETWICKEKGDKEIGIFLVLKKSCQNCGREYSSEFSVEKGIKCKKLILDIKCSQCDDKYQISFCLPEIIGEKYGK